MKDRMISFHVIVYCCCGTPIYFFPSNRRQRAPKREYCWYLPCA